MKNNTNPKYLNKLYRVYPENYSSPFTYFEGYLVNQNNNKFYFERLTDNALIIIEHTDIYRMYPIQKISGECYSKFWTDRDKTTILTQRRIL